MVKLTEQQEIEVLNLIDKFDLEFIKSFISMLEREKNKAQKELLEEIIDEYNKKEERTHFGLKLLSKKERLTLN